MRFKKIRNNKIKVIDYVIRLKYRERHEEDYKKVRFYLQESIKATVKKYFKDVKYAHKYSNPYEYSVSTGLEWFLSGKNAELTDVDLEILRELGMYSKNMLYEFDGR